MERFTFAFAMFALVTVAAWTAIQRSHMKHPFSGQDITIPGRDGEAWGGLAWPFSWLAE